MLKYIMWHVPSVQSFTIVTKFTIVLNVDDIQCVSKRRKEVKTTIQNNIDRTLNFLGVRCGAKPHFPGDFRSFVPHDTPKSLGF